MSPDQGFFLCALLSCSLRPWVSHPTQLSSLWPGSQENSQLSSWAQVAGRHARSRAYHCSGMCWSISRLLPLEPLAPLPPALLGGVNGGLSRGFLSQDEIPLASLLFSPREQRSVASGSEHTTGVSDGLGWVQMESESTWDISQVPGNVQVRQPGDSTSSWTSPPSPKTRWLPLTQAWTLLPR